MLSSSMAPQAESFLRPKMNSKIDVASMIIMYALSASFPESAAGGNFFYYTQCCDNTHRLGDKWLSSTTMAPQAKKILRPVMNSNAAGKNCVQTHYPPWRPVAFSFLKPPAILVVRFFSRGAAGGKFLRPKINSTAL